MSGVPQVINLKFDELLILELFTKYASLKDFAQLPKYSKLTVPPHHIISWVNLLLSIVMYALLLAIKRGMLRYQLKCRDGQ